MARRYPEAAIQRAIATYLSKVLPADAWFSAVAHGVRHGDGDDSWLRGAISKGMGTKSGVPDMLVVYQGRAMWGEVKAPDGSLTEAQRIPHSALTAAGCPVAVWRSVDDTRASLAMWGIPTRETKLSTERIQRGIITYRGKEFQDPATFGFPESDNLWRKRKLRSALAAAPTRASE